jgi:homoserine kinase type II
LERLRERYDLDRTDNIQDLGGSSCPNLLVTAGGARCGARVYRPYVTAARLEAIQRVRQELARGRVPCAEGVLTRGGEPWTEIDGRRVEVEWFVEWEAQMDSWERLEQGLPWLGRLHSLRRGSR